MSLLAFQEIIGSSSSSPESEKPYCFTALLIHGLLGCGDDFRDFSRSLASSLSDSYASDWRMVLVDLRNHGSSADRKGLSPPHDIANAAKDLADLVKSRNWAWPDVVIGHSLGGKVAFHYALSCAQGDYGDSAQLPKQLWILDSVPGKLEDKRYDEPEKALHTLHTLPSPIPSQEWLVDHMIDLGFSKFLSEWISGTLKKSGEHETFSFNVDGAIQMFKSARNMDYWPLLEHLPKGMEIAIVRTESRLTWDPHVVERLESLANVSVHVIPRSGHWVYKDEPQRLLEIMAPRIASMVRSKLEGLV